VTELKDLLKRNITKLIIEGKAADQAHNLGLKSVGYGNWADDSGKVVAKSADGGQRLIGVKAHDKDIDYATLDDSPNAKKADKAKAKSSKSIASAHKAKPKAKPKTSPKAKEQPMGAPGKKISSSQNTLGADVNEIGLGAMLVGGDWSKFHDSKDVQKQMNQRREQIGEEEFADQMGRAKAMATATEEWANQNGYKGKIVKTWWTARPGELGRAVGRDVDSRKNPTDTLVQFEDGQFLGLSAKSTGGKGDIGFKNPGIGTLEKQLDTDFSSGAKNATAKAIKQLKLPESSKERKQFIRSNPELREKTVEIGKQILGKARDDLAKVLGSMDEKELKRHILEDWMDAGAETYPPYIKITGHGKGGDYSASLMDPANNPKIAAVQNGKVKLVPVGSDSIGVVIDGKRLMKMRFKYESEKLASGIKLSGDPWVGTHIQ